MQPFFRNERGFTWIELLLLVALIGIVSALAMPKIQMLREAAREAATKANIAAIKSAISIYYGDHEGIWPNTLDVNDKTPGYGFGNYLESMPKVKVTHPQDPSKSPAGDEVVYKAFSDAPNLAVPNTEGKGWRYDGPKLGNTGRIWVNNSYLDSQGISYTTYGNE